MASSLLPVSQPGEPSDIEGEEALREMEIQVPAPTAGTNQLQPMPTPHPCLPTGNPRLRGKQPLPTGFKTKDDLALAAFFAEAL